MASVVYYVFAHQDDWQLFRGHQAQIDVDVGAKVVFVCVTAGDGGLGSVDLCVQRERGMINSCRLATDHSFYDTVLDPELVEVNGHLMARFEYKNTVSYFLRIRDGGNGPGGPLERLRNEGIPTVMTGVATPYSSWTELLETLKAILETERDGEPHPWVNSEDPDANADLTDEQFDDFRDNPDHVMVGAAVRDISRDLTDYLYVYFRGYPIGAEPIVLDIGQTVAKSRLFTAYLSGGADLVQDYNDAKEIYDSWLPRSHPV